MGDNIEDMKSEVENEFISIERGQGWNKFFNEIRNECAELYDYTSSEAKKSVNKDLNRYRDVNPYDHSRIILSKGSSDYINANLVVVDKAKRKYILTQGPLPQTTSHFWLMVWDQNCRAIVMLNQIIEKSLIKCHQYWPTEKLSADDTSFVFRDINLKVSYVSEVKNCYYTTTTLRIEDLENGCGREVIHYQYTNWPDFGVPQSPTAFLKFLEAVRAGGALNDSTRPTVVHCSAGIGRSGTFCLVDSCLVMLQDLKLTNVVVKDILMDMRRYRMGLIQTPSQLRFSYLAIIKGINRHELENGLLDEDVRKSDDESAEEETPPLPPPRLESLHRSPVDSTKTNEDNTIETNNFDYKTDDFVTIHQRKKEREEKHQVLEDKIKEVKKKLRESESWQNWKKSIIHPLCLGCLVIGGGMIVYALLSTRI